MSKFDKRYEALMASGGSQYDGVMRQIAQEVGINYDLWHRQIFLESNFNANAKSPTGPRGLGQFTKATGKAYGLNSDEDFFNPEKSLRASALHMKDLVHAAKGDELKATLMYNQGQGAKGKPQIDAYDRGDFSAISKEAANYMRLLGSKAQGGNQQFLSFAGVASNVENSAPMSFAMEMNDNLDTAIRTEETEEKINQMMDTESPFEPNVMKPKVTHSPQGASAGIVSKKAEAPIQGFEAKDYKPDGPGFFEGSGKAMAAGWNTSVPRTLGKLAWGEDMNMDLEDPTTGMGMQRALRTAIANDNNLEAEWTEKDLDRMFAAGVEPENIRMITRGRREDEELNTKVALDNQKQRKLASEQGLGAQLLGGIASEAWTLPYWWALDQRCYLDSSCNTRRNGWCWG